MKILVTGCAVYRQPCGNGDWLSGLSMGKSNVRPPTEPTPLNRSQKICHRWLCRRPLRLCQIRCISVHGRLLGT